MTYSFGPSFSTNTRVLQKRRRKEKKSSLVRGAKSWKSDARCFSFLLLSFPPFSRKIVPEHVSIYGKNVCTARTRDDVFGKKRGRGEEGKVISGITCVKK